METELYDEIFGNIPSSIVKNSYVFIPVDEAIIEMTKIYGIGLNELKTIAKKLDLKSNLYISRNYKNGPFSFDPSTFELDGLEVLDSYEENDNVYVIIGGIPLTAKQDNDIREQVRQIILNTEAVNKLNRDSLEKIFSISQPKDILNLCQTNKNFQNICNNAKIFERLLDIYYPNTVHTEDPKKQFIACASDIKTFYRIIFKKKCETKIIGKVYRYNVENILQMGKSSRIEDVEGWSKENIQGFARYLWENGDRSLYILLQGLPDEHRRGMTAQVNFPQEKTGKRYIVFYVDGLSIPKNETVFLLMTLYEVKVFKTLEVLANYYAEKNYDNYLTDLFEMFIDETEEGKKLQDIDFRENISDFLRKNDNYLLKFNEFLVRLGVRVPFTKENLKEQALKNEMLYLYSSDTTHNQYQIIKLTI